MASVPQVICLGGPTGSGKTAIALLLAQKLNCEIINADSRQTYADFPVITAQPTPEEQAQTPHHLYGYLKCTEKTSAGEWANLAKDRALEIISRGRIPLLVGGTGLYFRAILQGLAPIPAIPAHISETFAARMNTEGATALHSELTGIDPDYAATIHPHDRQRIQRALEVYASTGKKFSWWHKNALPQPLCRGPLLILDVKLAALEPVLKRRMDQMIVAGALKEACCAMETCANPDAPGWSGIGCAELLAFLSGKISRTECMRLWLAKTRAYAKRQITWFKAVRKAIHVPVQEKQDIKHLADKILDLYQCAIK